MPSLSDGTKIKMRQSIQMRFWNSHLLTRTWPALIFCIFWSFWGNLLKAKLFIEFSIIFINTLDHNFIPHLQALLRTIFVKGGPNWMLWMNWIFKDLLFQWWLQKRPILLWCHYSYVSAYLQPCWRKAITKKQGSLTQRVGSAMEKQKLHKMNIKI